MKTNTSTLAQVQSHADCNPTLPKTHKINKTQSSLSKIFQKSSNRKKISGVTDSNSNLGRLQVHWSLFETSNNSKSSMKAVFSLFAKVNKIQSGPQIVLFNVLIFCFVEFRQIESVHQGKNYKDKMFLSFLLAGERSKHACQHSYEDNRWPSAV